VRKRSVNTVGLAFGAGAYLIWGSFPLLFQLSKFASPFETVVWRVVFGFLFAAILVTITKTWGQILALVKPRKNLSGLQSRRFFIFINWQVYVVAVVTGNVIETSLGYFINPLVTVMFAVVLLKEKLRRMQWVALGVGLIAVLVLTVDYGRPPWIAIVLALSFGTYSLAKNRVGRNIGALQSFTIESATVLPIAIIQLIVVASFGPIMLLSGPMEAAVLIWPWNNDRGAVDFVRRCCKSDPPLDDRVYSVPNAGAAVFSRLLHIERGNASGPLDRIWIGLGVSGDSDLRCLPKKADLPYFWKPFRFAIELLLNLTFEQIVMFCLVSGLFFTDIVEISYKNYESIIGVDLIFSFRRCVNLHEMKQLVCFS